MMWFCAKKIHFHKIVEWQIFSFLWYFTLGIFWQNTMNVSWNLIGLIVLQNASQTYQKNLERNDFTHRHMRTKYLIFLGKWHQNRRLSCHNPVFSGLIIWDIFMMRYFQVSWDSNFNLNRLKQNHEVYICCSTNKNSRFCLYVCSH